MEVVASLSQGLTAAAQYGLFTHKSVPVIFEPTCIIHIYIYIYIYIYTYINKLVLLGAVFICMPAAYFFKIHYVQSQL